MSKQVSNKKQYSHEFKEQVLEVLENSPKSMLVIAKEFGVPYPTISNWKKAKESKSTGNLKQNPDDTKKLKQEVERLKKENEILKKAAAFFAKQLD